MIKNTAGQKLVVFAYDTTNQVPKLSDASNITAKISKNGASYVATNDVNPTELELGRYAFDLTQAETDCERLHVIPHSVTAGVVVVCEEACFTTEVRNPTVTVISPSAALNNQFSKTTDRNPNPLDCPRLAQKTFSISIFQLSSDGLKVAVTMTGRTLRVVFELPTGTDLVVIEDAGITKVGNTITFTNPVSASTPATGQRQMTGCWSCREVSTNFPWAFGSWQVFDVAIKD
jgi:hypothetical protein